MEIEKELFEKSHRLIGYIINEHTVLEKKMQAYVTAHYCDTDEKRHEFIDHVICYHLSFNQTKEIFVSLVRRHKKEFFKKYQKQLNMIDENINAHRIVVAHYLLDLTKEAQERYIKDGSVTFLKYKNGASLEIFDSARIRIFYEKCKEIKSIFEELKTTERD